MTRATTRPLAGALFSLAALVLLGLVVYSQAGVALDEHSTAAATRLYEPSAEPAATAFVSLADPAWALLIAIGLAAATALYRGQRRLAALALFIPAGAALSTGLLKATLTQSRVCMCLADERVGSGAWPSGHATLATAIVLAVVIVAAPRWRPAAALVGGGALAALCGALLVMGWHYPSDVLGGLLMGTTWALAGLALLELAERRRPASRPRETPPGIRSALAPLLAGFGAVTILAGGAATARIGASEALEHGYVAELAAGALIVTLCGALATALVLALRR